MTLFVCMFYVHLGCGFLKYLLGYFGSPECKMRHEAFGEIRVQRCNPLAEIYKRHVSLLSLLYQYQANKFHHLYLPDSYRMIR